MIKRVLLAGLLTLILGIPTMNAQDSYLSNDKMVLIQTEQDVTSSSIKTEKNKLAVALQVPYNINKLGIGVRFSYDFTDILRFSFDGNYYYFSSASSFHKINSMGDIVGKSMWGRTFDFNANLNFVFGDKNFHFYLITGLYLSNGYPERQSLLYDIAPDYHHAYADEVFREWGFGVNLGCGIEYQINDSYRVFLDQQLAIGLQMSWMPKVGVAFCF